MKIVFKYKFFIYCIAVLFAAAMALGVLPVVKIKDKASVGFSAVRVAEDIKYISKQPHSIEHPKERAVVRNYLYHRLEQMGGNMQIFGYDSIQCKFGGTFDIANVYAQFDPESVTEETQYILLVAHLDSRFFNIVRSDTVYSFGAADDGYGLGVILESVGCALKYRNEWKQGIKVLFTDSEEHELDGMYQAIKNDRYLFDNVNFVINVEARGVKGDALLFETSPGNKAAMDLYSHAALPRGFSLTTLVYKAMPNDTDFTLIKDSIPGLNFAVIDNLHYYHTNHDNYANISLRSIQHYGAQIEPVIKEYLVSAKYSGRDILASSDDIIFFAFPLLGMFGFTHSQYIIFNVVVYLLFLIALLMCLYRFRIKFIGILKGGMYALLFAAGALAAGTAVGYIAALTSGLEFNIVAVKYVKYDNFIVLGTIVLFYFLMYLFFKYRMGKDKYFYIEYFLGTLLLLFIFSGVLFITVFENFFLLIPLLAGSIALLLGQNRYGKGIFVLSAAIITLVSVYFLNLLYLAITIGGAGIILMLGTFSMIILLSQYYCFVRNSN